jgi:hypothetical protein
MGFLEILTLVFIVLKLTGVIGWHWLIVLSPSLLSLLTAVCCIILLSATPKRRFGFRER